MADTRVRGRLANPGFANQPIHAAVFFAGQARDGSTRYGGCAPSPNTALYTAHPTDEADLNWSGNPASRAHVLDQMISAGLNTIVMSSWGPPAVGCALPWAKYAPMQPSPKAQDELFAAASGNPVLIVPMLESNDDWRFRDEFPQPAGSAVAPHALDAINYLVRHYLLNWEHPEWAASWARIYDRSSPPEERYAVAIIQAGSGLLAADQEAAFAAGFERLADEVYEDTGVHVGFLLDPLPAETGTPAVYRPTPEHAGPYLVQTDTVLGILSFIPEIWPPLTSDQSLIAWKRDFSRRWFQTGIPFVMDVSPGYDAHIVFPDGHTPWGGTAEWRAALTEMVRDYGQAGIVYDSWNGYTEAMAAVPTFESGETNLSWLTGLARPDLTRRTYLPAIHGSLDPQADAEAAVTRAFAHLRSR